MLAEWRALGIREDMSHQTRAGGRPVTVIGARLGERETPPAWLDPDYGVVLFEVRRIVVNTGLSDSLFDLETLRGPG